VTPCNTEEMVVECLKKQHTDIIIVDFHQPAPFDCLRFLERTVAGRVPAIGTWNRGLCFSHSNFIIFLFLLQ
jgi:hypothetical protein